MAIPMTRQEVMDRYFLEIRCKILEVAASLDRLDRANAETSGDDSRMELIASALEALQRHGEGRAEQVQLIFSREYDPHWMK